MSTNHAARVRLACAVLVAAGAVGVALLAPRGLAPAHAAQPGGKDDSWHKTSDPLFPKDKKDVITGYDGCAACHAQTLPVNAKINAFAKNYKSHEFVLLSEGGTWLTEDPHSSATKVLGGPLGKQMTAILGSGKAGYSVTTDARCLTCHATDKYAGAPMPKEVNIKERFDTAQGVTCTACHGVRKDWQAAHYAPEGGTIPWRILTPDEKEKAGMRNMRDPVVKAKMCATCHVGDPDTFRVVTHDMYAAGHPPLPPFELGTFMNCEPMHWGSSSAVAPLKYFTQKEFEAYPGGAEIAKKDPNWMWTLYRVHPDAKEVSLARHVAAGAIASLHAEMKLIAADAAAVAAGEEGSVDFARFDCYACHHDLKYPSDRQARGYKWAPGRVPLKAWVSALPSIVAEHAAGLKTYGDTAKGFGDKWNAAQTAATVRPFGRPKDLVPAAKDMAAWCEAFMKKDQAETNPIYTAGQDGEASKLMAAIGKSAVANWSADPEAAMHLTWAFTSLRSHSYGKIDPKDLADLRTVVPVVVRQPRMGDMGKPTFSNKDGDPMTVGETLRERLDLFNNFKSKEFIRAFGLMSGAAAPK